MQVDFYHLTRSPIERVLPRIAQRVIGAGDRLLVVSGSAGQRKTIDRSLWTYTPESFLPHAEAGAAEDREQPVLIAADPVAGNGARHIALIDGEWREAALGFDRAFHFFDDSLIAAAREAWKGLANCEGVERRYWKQDENGGWHQAA